MPPIHSGNTSYELFCAAMVMMMTPGLAFFYGGMVQTKNLLTILMQCFVSLGITTIMWFVVGYSMSFGQTWGGLGIIGDPFQYAFLRNITLNTLYNNDPVLGIPLLVHVSYQMMFAIITPTLITGAFANRMSFKAWCLILILWQVFVYYPFVHMIWSPDGMMAKWGVLDFAGGTVVHINAGVAGLVCALVLGKRVGFGKEAMPPHNLVLTMVGASMLWVGWFGFNAGSALEASGRAGMAMLVTQIAAGTAAVSWMLAEWVMKKKASVLGIVSGAVAGLVAITPAAGFVDPKGALLLGAVAGMVCYWGATGLKHWIGYDDSLDAFGVHGVGGIIGAILTGPLAVVAIGGVEGSIVTQSVAVAATVGYTLVVTFVLLKLVDLLLGLRVSAEEEREGLDLVLHGERVE